MSSFLVDYSALIVKTCEKHIAIGNESNSSSSTIRQLHTYGIIYNFGNMLILSGKSNIRQLNENIFVTSGLLKSILNAVDFQMLSRIQSDDRYSFIYNL